MQCPAITRKGIPCPIFGEIERDGYCHVHDPNGKFMQQKKSRWSQKKKNSKAKRRYKRRLKKGWLNCEFPDCKKLYDPGWRRSKKGYHYCNLHYKVVRAKREKQLRDRRTKQGFDQFVYIFSLGFDDLYKIGKSRDWSQRLNSLKSSNPYLKPVAVVGTLIDYNTVEKTMHQRFREYKLQREIFKLDDELLDVVVTVLMEYGKIVNEQT